MKLQESPPGLEPSAEALSPPSRARHTTYAAGARSPLAHPQIRSRWTARLFGWLSPRQAPRGTGRADGEVPLPPSGPGDDPKSRGPSLHQTHSEIHGITKRLIAEDRYIFVLLREAVDQISDRDARPAWDRVHHHMALIPAGNVPVVLCDGSYANVEVGGFLLDRYAVSNRHFLRFVQSGGYDSLEIWPSEIWPSVSRFIDRTGRPGPRDWEGGKFPPGKGDHPVVGICWYEAMAYARWVGKRLPTAAEWQKAGGWPEQLSGGGCNRYPWGDLFDPERTNLWPSGIGRTAPVDAYPNGTTPNGIFQMSGNVWEWLDDPLETIPCQSEETFLPWRPMRRIVGGAFNTYLTGEATCQFITGQGDLDRRDNIGFRCGVSVDRLRPLP